VPEAIAAIVTVPPYAPFLSELAAHPLVCGLRLNTVMPLAETPAEVLTRLAALGPPLWVDLKGRQLRVAAAAVPPFTEVRVSHRIRVRVPADAFFDDGREHARIVAVDGDRLILEDGPRRVIGPGESVNVVHPSLEIEGTLTQTDRAYLEAMKETGLRRVMLSYVERPEDVEEVKALLPDAEVVLKIESRRGLAFAARHGSNLRQLGRLMAARGDLYIEVVEPHRIVGALRSVIQADPGAIAGSRLFPSLARFPVPEASDVTDAAFLMSLGYRTFLLGDEVCLRRDSVMAALYLLSAVAGEM
jgi:pyruvate kinase